MAILAGRLELSGCGMGVSGMLCPGCTLVGWLEHKQALAEGSWGILLWDHPDEVAGVEVGIGWGFLHCSV